MKVTVSGKQYFALLNIYGPPANVHHMIMCARGEIGFYIIEGEGEDFDELLSLISEEIGEGLCSKSDARELLSICKKVDPASLDWIGW